MVELSGSEAHRRRHAINSNVDTNVSCVCRSQLNSVCQLAAATLKNLTEEIKLKEKEECMVPSQEHLRLQFSPSYPNRLTSIRITDILNIKRIATKKNVRAFHKHAHHVAALNRLMRHDLFNCRKQLEEEEVDVDSSLTLSWEHYVEANGLDDKARVRLSRANFPVAATTYNKTKPITSGDAEVHTGDHSYTDF